MQQWSQYVLSLCAACLCGLITDEEHDINENSPFLDSVASLGSAMRLTVTVKTTKPATKQ